MANAPPCPKRDDLQRFLVGRLPEADSRRLQQHLAGCASCLDTLRQLEAKDPLVEAMRVQGNAAERSEEDVVAGLVEYLGGLRPPATTVDDPVREGAGAVLGPFKLLDEIGEGGFGVVYLAEQKEPIRRKVAL